jgi:hypothetical protein
MSRTSATTFFLWKNERKECEKNEAQKQSNGERACEEFSKLF